MTRRVRWRTVGAPPFSSLNGVAVVTHADVLPVTAALRALQKSSGLQVVACGSRASKPGTRRYSVRLVGPANAVASCQLELTTECGTALKSRRTRQRSAEVFDVPEPA